MNKICEITIRKKMESMMNSNSMDGAPSSGSFGQQSESDIARSLKINPQSKTPYSDSTQVRPSIVSLKKIIITLHFSKKGFHFQNGFWNELSFSKCSYFSKCAFIFKM